MSYSEIIKYDPTKDEFFIERESEVKTVIGTLSPTRQKERLPLSSQGWSKEIEVYALVQRTIENLSFEQPRKVVWYLLPIKYTVDSKFGKYWFLKREIARNPETDSVLVKVMLKNMEDGSCREAPMPNALSDGSAYPFLEIVKGKAKRLKKLEVYEHLKAGDCVGLFDFSLQNRVAGV